VNCSLRSKPDSRTRSAPAAAEDSAMDSLTPEVASVMMVTLSLSCIGIATPAILTSTAGILN
jgi:hypothetical protein